MTDRDFWQRFYRHCKGLADLVKERADESSAASVWPKTIAGVDIRHIDSEKLDRIVEIVREK